MTLSALAAASRECRSPRSVHFGRSYPFQSKALMSQWSATVNKSLNPRVTALEPHRARSSVGTNILDVRILPD